MESGAFLAVAFASLFSMDTWQGNLYEPVTLHKYLYANANPVKYKDPSGNMGSLQECNLVSAISAELYKNQNVILATSMLTVMMAHTTASSVVSIVLVICKMVLLVNFCASGNMGREGVKQKS